MPKKSNNNVVFVSVGVVLLAVFASVIPISGQTLLSRTLDNVGQSKISAGLDFAGVLSKDSNLKSLIGLDPLKPESCANSWSAIKDQKIYAQNLGEYAKNSSNFVGSLMPIGDLSKELKFDIKGDSRTDISQDYKNINVQFGGIFTSTIDLPAIYNKLRTIEPKLAEAPAGLAKIQGNLNFGTIVKNQDVFVKLEEFNLIQPSDYAFKLGFPNWYKFPDASSSQNLDMYPEEYKSNPEFQKMIADQKIIADATKEMNKEINEYNTNMLKNTSYSQLISEDTFKDYATLSCSLVESFDVSKTKSVDLGSIGMGSGQKDLREIKLKLKPTFASMIIDKIFPLGQKTTKDPVFRSFYTKLSDDVYNINMKYAEKLKSNPIKFDPASFDKMFEETEGSKKSMSDSKAMLEKNAIISAEFSTLVSNGDTTPFSSGYDIKILPTGNNDGKPNTLDTLSLWHNKSINQGIAITGNSFNIKYGSKATPIDDTKDAKDINELGQRLMQDKGLQKAQQLINPRATPTPNSTVPKSGVSPIIAKDPVMGDMKDIPSGTMSDDDMTKFLNN